MEPPNPVASTFVYALGAGGRLSTGGRRLRICTGEQECTRGRIGGAKSQLREHREAGVAHPLRDGVRMSQEAVEADGPSGIPP